MSINKRKPNEPIVIEFNLSKAVIILIAIIVLIGTITTAKVVTTMMEAKERKLLASEEQDANSQVTWVESTHLDEEGNTVVDLDTDGNAIKVPVPKRYTASQIEGETSANSGFVIYEGDIDWSTIIVESEDGTTTNEITTNETSAEEITTSSQEDAIDSDDTANLKEVINSENTANSKEVVNSENTINSEENTFESDLNFDENSKTENSSKEKNYYLTGVEIGMVIFIVILIIIFILVVLIKKRKAKK